MYSMILQNVFAFLGIKNEAILALEIEIKERLLETRKRSDGVLQAILASLSIFFFNSKNSVLLG